MRAVSVKSTTRDITILALAVAVIEVFKFAMANLANIELTSFLMIVFTLHFGKKIGFVVPVFILVEGVVYSFGVWWIMYLYAWPLLVIVTSILRKNDSAVFWAVVSGIFGLLFGFMCAIPYLFMGGIHTAFSWWIAGIPFDLVHGVSNFLIMLILYKPVTKVLKKVNK